MSALIPAARRLVFACEIAGFVHDLGKLHPGFADEKLDGGKPWSASGRVATGISEGHGKILEAGRLYPLTEEIADNSKLSRVLEGLLDDPAWAAVLALPTNWVKPDTIQARGLGAPLRQHHATKKYPKDELTLIGDLYAFGADIRDSALDKGSGGTEGGRQQSTSAETTNAFGQHRSPYSSQSLATPWRDAVTAISDILFAPQATDDLVATRTRVLQALAPIFENALGETRRPTNDVTLRHHAHSTASFFKAAVAEGALRADFTPWQTQDGGFDVGKLGRVRFRLLGIRWDWPALTRGMLSAVALASLSGRRREVVDALRTVFEEETALGNLIYEDDDGVLVLVPGFFEPDAAQSEALFAQHVLDPLTPAIARAIEALGTGTPFRLCWSAPALYLSDYAQALGLDAHNPHQRTLQAGEEGLRALWSASNVADHPVQICPQCALRPAEAREYTLTESAVRAQPLCAQCTELADHDARRDRSRNLDAEFGFRARSFNLEELATDAASARIALFSVRVDAGGIANGTALLTQLARPIELLTQEPALLQAAGTARLQSANALGDWFERLLVDVRAGRSIDEHQGKLARHLLGDFFWLSTRDGRGSALEVLEGFLLRESADLPDEWQLARHDGDRLALFAMRKHPSPARLQRVWDDLRTLWRTVANELAGELGGRLVPLTLDGRGLRFAVAATDADTVVRRVESILSQHLTKLRGGFAAHVSCVVTRPKFPLYLALDALERLERRVAVTPRQRWQLESTDARTPGTVRLLWSTPQGLVRWTVDTATQDPAQADRWHPHVVVTRRGSTDITGPDRIVHVADLRSGDEALIPPMTFDFIALEGSARRHQLAYQREGEALRRPHWVMGQTGCAPRLLEAYADFASLLDTAGWDIGKTKRLQGEMVETYEKWVRDVPAALRAAGTAAWHAHLHNLLLRYISGENAPARRQRLFAAITDGRLFDAVEWTTFVSKPSRSHSVTEATA